MSDTKRLEWVDANDYPPFEDKLFEYNKLSEFERSILELRGDLHAYTWISRKNLATSGGIDV